MKTSSLVHLMITVCMIYGCSDNSPKSILTDIDSFIQERPDSALAILDTMDRASLKTERLKAHHALLHAMALDKNFIDVSNDSIARVAVDYYATRGSRKSYARSLYYLGLAYFYQEEYTKAIVEFTKAESVAVTSDSLYLGFSKVGLADTYGKSYNYGEEENNLKEAFDIFSSLSLNYYSQATLLRLANVYFNTSQTEKSIEILSENLKKTIALYKQKRNLMLDCLEKYMPKEVTWTKPDGGLFMLVTLPETMNSRDLFDIAIKENVAFIVGDVFFCDGGGQNTLRLNFSYVSDEKMIEGVKRLANAVKILLNK